MPDFNLCISLLGEHSLSSDTEESDPLPKILQHLAELYGLLQHCHFKTFWTTYRSNELEIVRVNYTVECAGFEESIREAALRAIYATFRHISYRDLSLYLDLYGENFYAYFLFFDVKRGLGSELTEFLRERGWSLNLEDSLIPVPRHVDYQSEISFIQENIEIPRNPSGTFLLLNYT